MSSFFRQSRAMIKTNLSSIRRRLLVSLSMVLSVALVVIVLLGFLAMSNGFRQSLISAGAPDVGIVLSQGSLSELTSQLTPDQLRILGESPEIARDEDGTAIVSAEILVPVDVLRRDTGKPATLSLRGIGPHGLTVRSRVKLAEGRMFAPGSGEIIVGQRLAQDYDGLNIGDSISFGRSSWTVVGHFSADGSVFESEIMADAAVVQALFNRQNMFQSLRVKLSDPATLTAFADFANQPQLQGLTVTSEQQYFAAQSRTISQIILWLGWPLAITMAIGAGIGAMTTMYSSVSDRTVEIATVRAIGFSRSSAFVGTLTEAIALTLIGCAIGSVVAWLALDGLTASTRGADSTQIGFQLALSWGLVVKAVLLSLAVGVLGGGLPALRATRVPLRAAMSGRV
ncbi:MAG: ABC transporter permease [Paracoccaceae bacterium]